MENPREHPDDAMVRHSQRDPNEESLTVPNMI